jgi:hypothetical protein
VLNPLLDGLPVGVTGPETKVTVLVMPSFTVEDAPVHETSKIALALHAGLMLEGTVRLINESTLKTLCVENDTQPLAAVLVYLKDHDLAGESKFPAVTLLS